MGFGKFQEIYFGHLFNNQHRKFIICFFFFKVCSIKPFKISIKSIFWRKKNKSSKKKYIPFLLFFFALFESECAK